MKKKTITTVTLDEREIKMVLTEFIKMKCGQDVRNVTLMSGPTGDIQAIVQLKGEDEKLDGCRDPEDQTPDGV